MSSGGRPTLGAVLGGRGSVTGQAAQSVMDRAGSLLDTMKQNEELKGVTQVVRAAAGGGGEMQMDPVKSAIEALRAGAELANDRETKQQQASAQAATARVEEMRVKQEGELGIVGALTALMDKFGGGQQGGGNQLETFVRLLELTRPQQTQPQGMNMEGLAVLIGALTPIIAPLLERRGGDGTGQLATEFNHRMELLAQEVKHLAESRSGGGGTDLGSVLAALKQVQEITGTSPGQSIEVMRINAEKELGMHEITQRERSKQSEQESNGQLLGGIMDLAKAWSSGEAKRDGGGGGPVPDAPQTAAARKVSIRCGECGGVIPIQGEPPAQMNCPHCGATIGRGVS